MKELDQAKFEYNTIIFQSAELEKNLRSWLIININPNYTTKYPNLNQKLIIIRPLSGEQDIDTSF